MKKYYYPRSAYGKWWQVIRCHKYDGAGPLEAVEVDFIASEFMALRLSMDMNIRTTA